MATRVEFLCDTSVLIDYLRGEHTVREIISYDNFSRMSMSSVTLMELLVGAFNKREVKKIKSVFQKVHIIQVNEAISAKAVALIEEYSKSHNLLIPDALIAATAIESDLPLYTRNGSDFRFIPQLELIKENR